MLVHARLYWGFGDRSVKMITDDRDQPCYSRIRRKANRACTHSQCPRLILLFSAAPAQFSLFVFKMVKRQKEANKKPQRGTRSNVKATHYSKNSNELWRKAERKGFKKSQGAKLIPPTCTGILIWLFMWRGFEKRQQTPTKYPACVCAQDRETA